MVDTNQSLFANSRIATCPDKRISLLLGGNFTLCNFGSAVAICYPCRMKVNEILLMLKMDGWYLAATQGSHRQFKHPVKKGRVTVPGKPSDDLAPGTLSSIPRVQV